MELVILARFRAREGRDDAVAPSLPDVVARTCEEPGRLANDAYRSTRNPRLFYIFNGKCVQPRTPALATRPPAFGHQHPRSTGLASG